MAEKQHFLEYAPGRFERRRDLDQEHFAMASKSRATQERLVQLEKSSAPFGDQLIEAAKFIGVRVKNIGGHGSDSVSLKKKSAVLSFYGKEEWLLKWLLKKLQAPKDDIPRKSILSWKLLTRLIQTLPISNTARILTERKFLPILRQTLEEVEKLAQETLKSDERLGSGSRYDGEPISKKSKKRRRSGELVVEESAKDHQIPDLLMAISITLEVMISFATLSLKSQEEDESDSMFSTEYMKMVLRSTGEESAKVLGSWLSLSYIIRNHAIVNGRNWLSPFIAIWQLRSSGPEDLIHFSLHCSESSLALLRHFRSQGNMHQEWESEVEQLVARNIMIPARAANVDNGDLDLLNTLTRLSIIQESANAPILFETAIVSMQPRGAHRRRQDNDTWLQAVFTTLREAMPLQRVEENGAAIQCMLDTAMKHNVQFDLSILYAIVSEFAILPVSTNWALISTIVKLDANTFLVPNENKDLLGEVLRRITEACIGSTWVSKQKQIVVNVVVPLMGEFAKARDLSGFIRHWFTQIVAFEELRDQAGSSSLDTFSAWEDDALQEELKKLLEPSLTVQQLIQLLEWLSEEVDKNSNAVCLILEAISGSITSEIFVDAIGLRPYHIMFSNHLSQNLDKRYRWRLWRSLSRTLSWLQPSGVEEFSQLCNQKHAPFDSLSSNLGVAGLLKTVNKHSLGLEILETLRFGCLAWSIAPLGSEMKALAEKLMLNLLQGLAADLKSFSGRLVEAEDLGSEVCGSYQNTLYRGVGWIVWSCVRCVFVENAQVLGIGTHLPEATFQNILRDLLWVASITPEEASPHLNPWLHANVDAFPSVWRSLLNNEVMQDDENLKVTIVDVLLSSQTNADNPLMASQAKNRMVVQSLTTLPLDVFSKKERERIMKAWIQGSSQTRLSEQSYDLTSPDSQVLALKVKIMHRPSLYEGIKYKELISIADSITDMQSVGAKVNIGLLRELTKLTLLQVTENLDQPRNRIYALEMVEYVQKKLNTQTGENEKTKHKWNPARVALFEATLVSLAVKRDSLDKLSILSSSDLLILTTTFEDSLLSKLQKSLRKGSKLQRDEKQNSIMSFIDALTAININKPKLASLVSDAKRFLETLDETEHDMGMRVAAFFSGIPQDDGETTNLKESGDTSTIAGRQSIIAIVQTMIDEKDQDDRLELLASVFSESYAISTELDRLLAVKHIISACSDSRRTFDEDDDEFDLSSAYSQLCGKMWRVKGYREFAVITETMEMMLRTKGRAISQWNVDSTLGGISILCSRRGPNIRSSQAGKIYLHLCHLLQAILTSHRLKLEGHFHLVVQCLASLLRCLFTPLPYSNSSSKLFSPPPWLPATSPQLNNPHAAAFTRLLTLICNPSVSSVTRSQHNALTSATDKAKRMAGQHMQYVLMAYIRLQLEMKMLPTVKEQLIPGIYALFDTTTPELRRAINEGLDGSGRAMFRILYTDYTKFGKWKGS